MDDALFELLKKIDQGFEEGSGPYGRENLDEVLNSPNNSRSQALLAVGNEGLNLRMDVMKAVEEKARRADAERPAECRNPNHLVSCKCAVLAHGIPRYRS